LVGGCTKKIEDANLAKASGSVKKKNEMRRFFFLELGYKSLPESVLS
jgi:hypothetical protein